MNRTAPIAAAAAALLLISGSAFATTKAAKATKPAAEAAAPAPVALTEGQLAAAGRVYTGEASCEFGEKVHLTPVDGKPGHFKMGYKKASYYLVPEETTTGAVRLEDRRAGIVWLQIPAKSMLMNSKIGQRMADGCLHAEQRATATVQSTDGSIGIAAAKP
jgi:hypothetical protein